MKIEQIDKNFAISANIKQENLEWLDVKEQPFSLHGIIYDQSENKYVRMPQKIADKVSDVVKVLNSNTAGGRIRFKTNSSYIAIKAVMKPSSIMPHMPRTGQSGFDLYRNDKGKETYFCTFVPPASWFDGYSNGNKTFGELTDYTINFPLYDGVQELYVGIKQGAVLQSANVYKYTKPIVFYGSSITQGGCASRPGNSYQAIISRRLNADFINLGFSGAGMGEKQMAEYISTLSMSAFVFDYDSNAPTAEWLNKTHYDFYKIIRDKNSNLPIIILTHSCALHGVFYKTKAYDKWGTFEKRFEVIQNTFERAKKEGDNNVYFIDGKEIFEGIDWDSATVDGVHPNDLGFFRYANILEPVLKRVLGE